MLHSAAEPLEEAASLEPVAQSSSESTIKRQKSCTKRKYDRDDSCLGSGHV